MLQKSGFSLTTIEQWEVRAGPKRAGQWKDGRSAKESAKAWIASQPFIPTEILDCLQSHPDFGTLKEWHAEPESLVPFDSFRGPANLDVLLVGMDDAGPMIIAVEAKADESFGDTVGGTLIKAQKRLKKNPKSKGIERARGLVEEILGGFSEKHMDIRYQLLTASAAAIEEAKRHGAKRAVLLIHEFRTDLTTEQKLDSNLSDLLDFLQLVSVESIDAVNPGALLGPFYVPLATKESNPVGLYLGKAVRELRGVV